MKKILILLFASIAISSSAHKISLIMEDGYYPLIIKPKVIFFIKKEYTEQGPIPVGTYGKFIVTLNCKDNTYRRILTEIYNPYTHTITKMFKTDDDIGNTMLEQKFIPFDSELIPISTKLCPNVAH